MSRAIVLDNEAIQALWAPRHPKRRAVLAHIEANLGRPDRARKSAGTIVAPTAAIVEAHASAPDAQNTALGRLRVRHDALDRDAALQACQIDSSRDLSVAERHVGIAALRAGADPIVLTSDPDDIKAITGTHATVLRV